MTSGHVVLDNIGYWAGVLLPRAALHADWTADDIERAVRWARYCEVAAAALDDRPELVAPLLQFVSEVQGAHARLSPARCRRLLRRARLQLLRRLLLNQRLSEAAVASAQRQLQLMLTPERCQSLLSRWTNERRALALAWRLTSSRRLCRRQVHALAMHRYLSSADCDNASSSVAGSLADAEDRWLRSKCNQLMTGKDGPLLAALALTQPPLTVSRRARSVNEAVASELSGWLGRHSQQNASAPLLTRWLTDVDNCDALSSLCRDHGSDLRAAVCSVLNYAATTVVGADVDRLASMAVRLCACDEGGDLLRRLVATTDAGTVAGRRWRLHLTRHAPLRCSCVQLKDWSGLESCSQTKMGSDIV